MHASVHAYLWRHDEISILIAWHIGRARWLDANVELLGGCLVAEVIDEADGEGAHLASGQACESLALDRAKLGLRTWKRHDELER